MNATSLEHFDIAIIGGGPAGATAALGLNDSGLRVAVIDKSTFPRDKICGDAIGGHALKILKALPFDMHNGMLQSAEMNRITGLKFFAPNGKSFEVSYVNHGFAAKRLHFDDFLFRQVRTLGNVVIKENRSVENILTEKEKMILALSGGESITASLVIGCDGAHSVAAKQLADFKMEPRHYLAAVRAYYRNIEGTDGSHALEVHLFKGFLPGYFWIFPLRDNFANVGFGMSTHQIKKRNINLKQSFQEIIETSPVLRQRFRHAELTNPVKGFGLPVGGKRRSISGNRFMLCGDAASLIDPLTGEGIGNAMLSGRLAAEHAIQCFRANDFSAVQTMSYENAVYKSLLPELKRNLRLQPVANRTWLVNLFVNFAVSNPAFKDLMAKSF